MPNYQIYSKQQSTRIKLEIVDCIENKIAKIKVLRPKGWVIT